MAWLRAAAYARDVAKKPTSKASKAEDDAPLLSGFGSIREAGREIESKDTKAVGAKNKPTKAGETSKPSAGGKRAKAGEDDEPERLAKPMASGAAGGGEDGGNRIGLKRNNKPGKAPVVQEVGLSRTAVEALPAPVPFDSIVGQSRGLDVLRRCLTSGKLHHAWVFHGPEGVGKFTTALSFAATLLDPGVSIDAKGRVSIDEDSPAQAMLRAGSHPDLHVVTKELAAVSRDAAVRGQKQRNIPKAVLEEFLIEPATRTSAVARTDGSLLGTKGANRSRAAAVYIVDEADLIDPAGQNTLLKTLEEPAPGRVIILVTSAPERLLTTVWSRCQRVGFAPLGERETLEVVQRVLQAVEEVAAKMPGGLQREWLLRFAGGSPGLALMAIHTGLIAWQETLEPMLRAVDAGNPPLEFGETLAKLVDQWAEAQIEGKATASKEAAKAAGLDHMLRVLASHWRMRLGLEAASAEEGGGVKEGAGALRAIDLLRETEHYLAANLQPGFAFENLAASLVRA